VRHNPAAGAERLS
jgi:integrase